jgi:hypothetical protein
VSAALLPCSPESEPPNTELNGAPANTYNTAAKNAYCTIELTENDDEENEECIAKNGKDSEHDDGTMVGEGQ